MAGNNKSTRQIGKKQMWKNTVEIKVYFTICSQFIKKVQIRSELSNYHYKDILAFANFHSSESLEILWNSTSRQVTLLSKRNQSHEREQGGKRSPSHQVNFFLKLKLRIKEKSFCIWTLFLLWSLPSVHFLKESVSKICVARVGLDFCRAFHPLIGGVDSYGLDIAFRG